MIRGIILRRTLNLSQQFPPSILMLQYEFHPHPKPPISNCKPQPGAGIPSSTPTDDQNGRFPTVSRLPYRYVIMEWFGFQPEENDDGDHFQKALREYYVELRSKSPHVIDGGTQALAIPKSVLSRPGIIFLISSSRMFCFQTPNVLF